MLFQSLYRPNTGVDIEQIVCSFTGVEIPALRAAWEEVWRANEVLRTGFDWVGMEQPAQRIHDGMALPWHSLDWRNRPVSHREDLDGFLRRDRLQAFALDRPPLMRLTLIEDEGGLFRLIWTFHHILLDGRAFPIIFRQMAEAYDAHVRGRPVPAQSRRPYSDYIRWLEKLDWSSAKAYWKEQLKDFQNPTPLGIARPQPWTGQGELDYGVVTSYLTSELTAALRELCKRHPVTMNTLVQAAWAALLHRYSGEADVVFGAIRTTRRYAPGADEVTGLLINALPVRVHIAPQAPVRQLIEDLRRRALELRGTPYEHFPLADIQKSADLRRGTRLFESIIAYENFELTEMIRAQHAMLNAWRFEILSHVGYPLVLTATDGDRFRTTLEYSRALFDAQTGQRIVEHLHTALTSIADDPASPVCRLNILPSAERDRLLAQWNDTRLTFPRDRCIHQLFEAQAARSPDAVALVDERQSLTYRELNERTNRLAYVLQDLGVGPEVLVGICFNRCIEAVVSLLAILKAGGAYVPLNAADPPGRLGFMLRETAVPVILAQQAVAARLPESAARIICLDGAFDPPNTAIPNLLCRAQPANLAYTIYTSGSTGQAKGVMVNHESLVNAYFAWEKAYGLRDGPTAHLQMASSSFDVFSGDWTRALCSGGKLVICPHAALLDPASLYDLMLREAVDCAEFVPAVFRNLELYLEKTGRRLDFMKILVIASDTWFVSEALSILKRCGKNTRLINSYGVTECTIDSSYFDCGRLESDEGLRRQVKPGSPVPIGRPFANTQFYILDAYLEPVPLGVVGELYIGGAGVGRGYLKRSELTARRFVADVFSPAGGGRLYKTGDLARYLNDGTVEFLGREDNQVKIRGIRIELAEIEAALKQHPAIREAVVLARPEGGVEKRLAAYFTTKASSNIVTEVRGYLKQRLPDYMVPSEFLELKDFPFNSSGKIDRLALPEPDFSRTGEMRAYAAPRTTVERKLAETCSSVLGVENVGIHDNFFDLGGHSLLATRFLSRIQDAFDVELPLSLLFDTPDIARLADEVELLMRERPVPQYRQEHDMPDTIRAGAPPAHGIAEAELGEIPTESAGPASRPMPRIRSATERERFPLSFAQERLWLLAQMEPGSPMYNVPQAFRLRGPVDVAVLQQSLALVIARHESLRTVFGWEDGNPVQIVQPPEDFLLGRISPAHDWQAWLHTEANRPFSLTRAPLLRAALLQLGHDDAIFFINVHHIATDGWSGSVLLRELSAAYEAFLRSEAPVLPPLSIQYADYALWERERLTGERLSRQVDGWCELLRGVPSVLELPADYPRPPAQTYRGASRGFPISPDLMRRLRNISRQHGVTLYMTLLAALEVLLSRYAGQARFALGSAAANRARAETEGLIGCFINTLVLPADLTGNPTFVELLERVRRISLRAYANQDLPRERLIERLGTERDLSRNPLFQVMFILQNTPEAQLVLPQVEVEEFQVTTDTAKLDLTFTVSGTGKGDQVTIQYSTDLFDPQTIGRMAGHYLELLESVLSEPDQRVGRLSMLTTDERRRVLVEWNDTRAEYPRVKCIHELFEAQAERTPDRVAVIFEGQSMNYGELNRHANRLARGLQSIGLEPGMPAGICIERSIGMVIGLLGILKAGGTYVPLDPAFPPDRLAFMLSDSALRVLITGQTLLSLFRDRIGVDESITLFCLDSEWSEASRFADTNQHCRATPGSPAYIIYTSGSTGRPKGVQVAHASVVNLLSSMSERPGISERDTLLAITTLSFDIAALEIFLPLSAGAKLVVAPNEAITDGGRMGCLLQQHDVTLMQGTPAAWQLLLSSGWAGKANLRVFCGGDVLPRGLAGDLLSRCSEVWNLYGPTETTVWSAAERVTATRRLATLGRPIANTQIYVLDELCQPVPVGVRGELHIGGEGVACGYFNRPELTATKFVPNPFGPGRLYKTGDLGRYMPDGNIEFLGRIDHQVKIRGYRIELGEIEAVLSLHPKVREVAVVGRAGRNGSRQLVAYVNLTKGAPEDKTIAELRGLLRQYLPEYMIPAMIVTVGLFPLTPNGKIDRNALPDPDLSIQSNPADFVPPQTATEEILAGIWKEVIGVQRISRFDNFFSLGGDSILAMLCLNRARARGLHLTLRQIFEGQTIEALARLARPCDP